MDNILLFEDLSMGYGNLVCQGEKKIVMIDVDDEPCNLCGHGCQNEIDAGR